MFTNFWTLTTFWLPVVPRRYALLNSGLSLMGVLSTDMVTAICYGNSLKGFSWNGYRHALPGPFPACELVACASTVAAVGHASSAYVLNQDAPGKLIILPSPEVSKSSCSTSALWPHDVGYNKLESSSLGCLYDGNLGDLSCITSCGLVWKNWEDLIYHLLKALVMSHYESPTKTMIFMVDG